jgi:hypothetical protein
MLNNQAEYVSLRVLGRLCDYLVKHQGVEAHRLPGALFGSDPDKFWELLAGRQHLHFCLGTRSSPEWPGADYVMSTDSRLQGLMLSRLTQGAAGRALAVCPEFHLVSSPPRKAPADPEKKWENARQSAGKLYAELHQKYGTGCIFFGSQKVNPMLELCFATTFFATPFSSQDGVARPRDRSCPLFFRYREEDPKPDSFFGGLQLAKGAPAKEPGLYYEVDDGSWEACVCDPASSDAAFFFYAFYPATAHLEVACGGFSSRATNCLTEHLEEVVSEVGKPQFTSKSLDVGMYVIRFTFDTSDQSAARSGDQRPFTRQVIGLSTKVIQRRLNRRRKA